MGGYGRQVLLAHIDESGQPYQLKDGPFVLAAVTTPLEVIDFDEAVVKRFLGRWLSQLQTGYPQLGIDAAEFELHARSVVQGEGFWRKIKPDDRVRFLEEAADMIASLRSTLNIVVIEREPGAEVKDWRGIRKHALRILVERILMSMYALPRILLVDYDTAAAKLDAELRNELREAAKTTKFKHKTRVYVDFHDSKHSPLIQVADFVAYIQRMVSMHKYAINYNTAKLDIEKLYLKIERRIRRCPGRTSYEGCGLKIWQLRRRR